MADIGNLQAYLCTSSKRYRLELENSITDAVTNITCTDEWLQGCHIDLRVNKNDQYQEISTFLIFYIHSYRALVSSCEIAFCLLTIMIHVRLNFRSITANNRKKRKCMERRAFSVCIIQMKQHLNIEIESGFFFKKKCGHYHLLVIKLNYW